MFEQLEAWVERGFDPRGIRGVVHVVDGVYHSSSCEEGTSEPRAVTLELGEYDRAGSLVGEPHAACEGSILFGPMKLETWGRKCRQLMAAEDELSVSLDEVAAIERLSELRVLAERLQSAARDTTSRMGHKAFEPWCSRLLELEVTAGEVVVRGLREKRRRILEMMAEEALEIPPLLLGSGLSQIAAPIVEAYYAVTRTVVESTDEVLIAPPYLAPWDQWALSAVSRVQGHVAVVPPAAAAWLNARRPCPGVDLDGPLSDSELETVQVLYQPHEQGGAYHDLEAALTAAQAL